RKLRDLSQAQLAEMAGTTQQAIQQAEKGRARQPRYLHQLAQALDVPANWMVVGEEIGAEKKARNEKLGLSEKESDVLEQFFSMPEDDQKIIYELIKTRKST
ncbi:MAG: helix-turn-helix domain-containing protein, partial [Pseudomonadota bacterium]